MSEPNNKEVILAPRIVRIIAGIDFVLMFTFTLIGALVSLLPVNLIDLLNYLAINDPVLYNQILTEIANAGLTFPFIVNFFFVFGTTLIFVSIIGMIVALGTAYKKPWAIPLGVGVSILAITGGIVSYFFKLFFPFTPGGPLIILDLALGLFFGVLAINVFFVGAFLIWQMDQQPYSTIRIGRVILIWNLNTLSLLVTAAFYPGIAIAGFLTGDFLSGLGIAYIVVAVIAILNVLIRPVFTRIVSWVARWWIGFAISFILMFIVNGFLLWILGAFMPGFVVVNIWAAILAGLILAAINAVIVNVVGLDDDSSFFSQYVAKQIQRVGDIKDVPQTPGLVALEIDGLSIEVLQEALKREYMPTIQYLLDRGSHRLDSWDCGIPSMTSSCQAGILHGNNKDIPAFRWYVKNDDRMLTSNHQPDAQYIDQRASDGKGILRNGGSSVSNLVSGDATYSFFTMSTLSEPDVVAAKRRSEDLYYYLVNPWAMNRSIIYTIWDLLVEIGQIIKQTITRRKPRMNRLHKFYPGVRAATNIFMRDISTSMVITNITRGVPGIYVTFLGYDEIAHHSGPMTTDALKALRGLDKQIRRILHAIENVAPRPYNLFVLSDHGQSTGWTFKQRYGMPLKELIANLLEGKLSVGEIEAIDAHVGYVGGLVDDLNAGQEEVESKATKNPLRHFYRDKTQQDKVDTGEHLESDDVIVCASGNLAQIYFKTQKERLTLQDLEQIHSGFVSKLVAHEGVGFVIVLDANRGPILLGKKGAIELRTGKVDGTNPLIPYGREDIRMKQLLRLSEFPSAGDLTVVSPVYPDGSVAAYEELIGNHGGVGGNQTHAILLHPKDIKFEGKNIANAEQIYDILNQGRSDK
ncbi:MAG: alkaline phosphatase family protein [Candidatus Thorarchaeota archaeon]